jgi:hypothetical protein
LLTDWADVFRWLPKDAPVPLVRSELEGERRGLPRTRKLSTAAGAVGFETLFKQDDAARRIYYDYRGDLVPGVHNYVATTVVDEIEARKCRMYFASTFDLVPGADAGQAQIIFRAIYHTVASGMDALLQCEREGG